MTDREYYNKLVYLYKEIRTSESKILAIALELDSRVKNLKKIKEIDESLFNLLKMVKYRNKMFNKFVEIQKTKHMVVKD